MSQLSIGIEIRKSDLHRDLASAKKAISKFEKDQAKAMGAAVKQQADVRTQFAEKVARAETRSRTRSAKQAARAAEQGAKAESRALAGAQRSAERMRASGATRLARMDADLAKRNIALREHFENKSHRGRLRRMREATQEHDRQSRKLAKQHAANVAARPAGPRGGAVVGNAGRNIGGATRFVAGAAGIGAAVLIGSSVSKQIDVQRDSANLANQAALGGDKRPQREIQASILGQAESESARTGLDRGAIVGGLRAFVAISGDLKTAQASIGKFADFSQAFDANLEDVSRSAGIFSKQLELDGGTAEERIKALDEVMRAVGGGTTIGSVEFGDIAKIGGKLAAGAGYAGGSQKQALIDAASLVQLAVLGGASSGDDAGTAVARLGSDIVGHSKEVNALFGGKAFDKKGNLTMGMRELVLGLLDKTAGDPRKLNKIFNKESQHAINYLAKVQRGDDSGLTGEQSEAAKKFLQGNVSTAQVASGAAFARDQDGIKIAKAFEALNVAIGQDLLPVITNQFIPALTKATPAIASATSGFAEVANWAASEPFAAVASVAGLALAKALGGEAIQMAASGAITSGLATGLAGVAFGAIITGAIAASMERQETEDRRKKYHEQRMSGDLEGAAGTAGAGLEDLKNEGFFGRGFKFLGATLSGQLPSWLGGREQTLKNADNIGGDIEEETKRVRAEADSWQKIADDINAEKEARAGLAGELLKFAETVRTANAVAGGSGGRPGKAPPPTKNIGG